MGQTQVGPVKKPGLENMIELYATGMSTRHVASVVGLSHSYVAKLLRVAGVIRPRLEAVRLWSGRVVPTSQQWRTCRARARTVWKRLVGEIPEKHCIHHINGDFTDNRLENLQCLTRSNHAYLHHPANPVPRHLRESRRVYMNHYNRTARKEPAVCAICGSSYNRDKYDNGSTCSYSCRVVLRRRRNVRA